MTLQMDWNSIPVQGSRILIVDDNEQNVDLLEAFLEAAGYISLKAYSGLECLDLLEKESVDLVLLDIMMPHMDGFEVLERIRSSPKHSRLPVIIVTALQDKENRLRGLESGADEFLTKPVDRLELYARLKTLLRSKKIFDALEQSYWELKLLEKKREMFLHFLVHDLKNPISGILGHLQLIQMKLDKGNDLERVRHFSEQAEASAKVLLHMVQDILDVARIEDNKFPLEVVHTDVVALLRDTVKEFEGLAKQRGKAIQLDTPDQYWLKIDPRVTRRIFENLLHNALTHTPRGKKVTISVQKQDNVLKVTFRDQGQGIPEELFDKVFDPFERATLKKKGVHTGHGLGLTFCRMAAEAQGGRIYLDPESAQGRGAVFVVEFPLAS